MAKKYITDKFQDFRYQHDITADDMIVIDEYDDQTYRLFIPGSYQRDEIDQDFATVQSIREYLGLVPAEDRDNLLMEKEEILIKIKEAKTRLEEIEKELAGVRNIEDLIPDITARQKVLLDGLLRIIEKSDTVWHRFWGDVRCVALDEKGRQSFGPYRMIPPREEEANEE